MAEMLASEEMLASFLGAVLGGALSLIGVFLAYVLSERQAAKKDARDQQRLDAGLLRSVQTELRETWEHWMSVMGTRVLQSASPVFFQAKITEDFFTFYHANANKLGDVRNNDTQVLIVRVYTKYKVFNQNVRVYSEAVERGPAEASGIWSALRQENTKLHNLIQQLDQMIDAELTVAGSKR